MSSTSEKWLSKMLEENLEKVLRLLFFWEKDEKRIGVCIRFIHHFLIYSCFISYILLHTFMPSYLLFTILYSNALINFSFESINKLLNFINPNVSK